MDNKHAKIVLSVYRPHGQDANDPDFAEALKQVERDPSMATWFREQQQFDSDFAAALNSVAGPAEAKTMIKATMGASAGSRRRWWPLALVASLALVFATSWVSLRNRPAGLPLPENATLAQLATNLSEHHASIGFMSGDLGRIRQWLLERRGPAPDDLPAKLAGMKILGCETWKTTRGKVSLICFVNDGMQMAHLYIFENAADFPGLPPRAEPRLAREGNWSLALWQDDGHAYVLGSPTNSGISVESLVRS